MPRIGLVLLQDMSAAWHPGQAGWNVLMSQLPSKCQLLSFASDDSMLKVSDYDRNPRGPGIASASILEVLVTCHRRSRCDRSYCCRWVGTRTNGQDWVEPTEILDRILFHSEPTRWPGQHWSHCC